MAKTKIKLRTCEICGIKKNVKEFSVGKVCDKCETESTSTLREESTDDEISVSTKDDRVYISTNGDTNDDLRSLHTKIDHLHQRFDKMEVLMMGLMELVGKINYDMEINKVRKDE